MLVAAATFIARERCIVGGLDVAVADVMHN